ncbi:MAG: GTP-binding protein Era [Candidatus Xenolissoclinum pacificiensis L6]|uniref:GTPase Era n=1 Tax=Candidatus Xenolissoclinum pacificiensis L6 TaxID=1401685 RepID=W2UZS3_9RICK|nr:MAG: GTP-binding protein Era [Candidatus Xenolissoclinum pacificiensis L6]
MKRSLVCTIIGCTNAGKSTLMNGIMGRSLSAVSHKVQTTVITICTFKIIADTELIFYDTPGVFNPKTLIEKRIYKNFMNTFYNNESCYNDNLFLFLIDANKGITSNVIRTISMFDKHRVILVLNKVDLVKNKTDLLALSAELFNLYPFQQICMISARRQKDIMNLEDLLVSYSYPIQNWRHTEFKTEYLLSEITREQILRFYHKEIPYKLLVETTDYSNINNITKVSQTIHIYNSNHKKIILGKNNHRFSMLRTKVQQLIQKKFIKNGNVEVLLDLTCKVGKNFEFDLNRLLSNDYYI